MPTVHLTNPTVKQLPDKNSNIYYLIKDDETNQAYFCFEGAVKSGWTDLTNNWKQIKELDLDFETNDRGNTVTSLYVSPESDIFI